MVQSLNGTSNVAVSDGAVIGFDLGGAMNELSEGSIPSFASDPSKKTDFRRLDGTFVIANGIATNNDLKLDSQHLHASGAGTVDLPQRSLDYTVRPKLVANLGGDGGEANAAGIEVPVHITGSWEKPDISPDIEGAINAPGHRRRGEADRQAAQRQERRRGRPGSVRRERRRRPVEGAEAAR